MNIIAFFIGLASMFFAIFAINILWWRKQRSRFQTVLGCIMAVWCLWCVKDLTLTFPGMYSDQMLNWVLIIDGWSALTYMVLVCEVVSPGWVSWRRMGLVILPFVAFTAVYGLWPVDDLIYAYAAFLWCFAWAVVIIGYIKMKRYLTYIHNEYSNIDKIDVSWLRPVFLFCIIGQLLWLAISLMASPWADSVYYCIAIFLWLMVLYYSWNFQPIVIKPEPAPSQRQSSPIAKGELERIVEEQQLYLNKNLMLQDLAQAMNTNRTYISSYLSQQRQQTFYDYINQLRIERVSIPLMKEHPEYKLDYVASESGFASLSTFRRAFIKLTGQTPGQKRDFTNN